MTDRYLTVTTGIPNSAYVHIPFCRRRCFYCDFPVFVVGDRLRGETSGSIAQYVEVLCQEITMTPNLGEPLVTIFFGGGTPSLLSPQQLELILTALDNRFGISHDAEISIEMDPGTFDLIQIKNYTGAGVNRVSLGVQAFQDDLLELCGRSHSFSDILPSIDLIHQVQIPEFSLDLISGLPHQTLDMWQESLGKAIASSPTHISIYDLTIEPTTPFGRYYKPGDKPLPSDETTVQMYQLAQEKLTNAGYEHYEISNYAQPGHQCRHNLVYWQNRSYYGFGMGAASYVEGRRFTRPRKTKEYYQWIQDGGVINCEPTPPEEVLLDTLMVGLRLAEGLSLAKLAADFGKDKVEQIYTICEPYHEKGWVEVIEGRLRLSDPQGFLFSNVVLARLFEQLASQP